MAKTLPSKDPTEEKPYGVDWSDFLLREDTTIDDVEWSAPVPNTVTTNSPGQADGVSEKVSPGTVVAGAVTYIWFRGGVGGTRSSPSKYSTRVTITTADGKKQVERIIVPVAEK